MAGTGTQKSASASTTGSKRRWEDNRWVDQDGFEIIPPGDEDQLVKAMMLNIGSNATNPDYETERTARLTQKKPRA